MRKSIELAANVLRACDVGTPTRFPVHGGKKAPGHCPKCGATLIRGPSVSVCENWRCESLPTIAAPAASLDAWVGL
jgi:hypothetical protein